MTDPLLLSAALALSIPLAVIGLGLAVRGATAIRQGRDVTERIDSVAGQRHGEQHSRGPVQVIIRRMARASVLSSKEFDNLARLARAAGIFERDGVYRFIALRLILTIGVCLASFAAALVADLSYAIAAMSSLLAMAVAYLAPYLLLPWLARMRCKRIFRELPFFLDCIKLLLQSGASIELSLRHIENMDSVAFREIQRTLSHLVEDLDQGKSYAVTFQRWAEKLVIRDGEELAGLILQSVAHGTELSAMLAQFTRDLIERRLTRARETAGRRSVSLTVVMLAFFLPPLLVIIAAPAITDVVRHYIGMFG